MRAKYKTGTKMIIFDDPRYQVIERWESTQSDLTLWNFYYSGKGQVYLNKYIFISQVGKPD